MKTFEWSILQLVFSCIVIFVNSTLLYLLSFSKLRDDAHFEKCLKRLGISLAFSHILSAACLIAADTITLFVHHYIGAYFASTMVKVETFILSVTVISVLFHMTCMMVNDFKFVNNIRMFTEENTFYLVVVWISTSLCAFLMFFVYTEDKITEIFCVVIIITNALLAVSYGDILRRTVVQFRRAEEFGCAYVAARLQLARKQNLLFFGIMLTSSFIVFTVPFSLERLLWQQNHVVSYICVTLNSILQGLIFIIGRPYIKL